jgi:hypothetical protein
MVDLDSRRARLNLLDKASSKQDKASLGTDTEALPLFESS